MTPTESMLLRAVLESPGDDTPRLGKRTAKLLTLPAFRSLRHIWL